MNILTTIPLVFGYPLYVWLGMILVVLLTLQIYTGIKTFHGKMWYFKIHRVNFILIIAVGLLHAYMALGVWFFHFQIK
ncbi:MAG: hypothetical protein PHC97_03975 [Patescibacteria group bacterium]|nr:hypothetical protein [Patescibacteria group bacterium]